MALFRRRFTLANAMTTLMHVSADERYELFLDGRKISRGPERGDLNNWYFETTELTLAPGTHTLVARVWALGTRGASARAPWAQMSIRPGFFCCPEAPELVPHFGTGHAAWEITPLDGITFESMSEAALSGMGAGPSERVDGGLYPWGWETGESRSSLKWFVPQKGEVAFSLSPAPADHPWGNNARHWLRPAALPASEDKPWSKFQILRNETGHGSSDISLVETAQWEAWLHRSSKNYSEVLIVPAHSIQTLLIDLGNYVCAYPHMRWRAGDQARVSIGWAEGLRLPGKHADEKIHNPSAYPEAIFIGPSDHLSLPAGLNDSHQWHSHWWRCGRFVQLRIETADTALTLESFVLSETRFPFDPGQRWKTGDAKLDRLFSVCVRTLQLCSHETYMDCPYYEQLMYVGDTRLQALMTYALTADTRLPRKAIALLDSSRTNPTGLIASAHPCASGQLIPSFALWWVAMVYDHALWRGDADFVRQRMPGVRAVLDRFLAHVDQAGALVSPVGWSFLDWTFKEGGVPPGGLPGERNSSFHAQWFIALKQAAELESWLGEPELAARWGRHQSAARDVWHSLFWDEARGLMADDVHHTAYSEHAQCLALLAGVLAPAQQQRAWTHLASKDSTLTPVSSYFSHYLFEACFQSGQTPHPEIFNTRLAPWFKSLEEGFETTPETFGPTRSDCHAWSAHPVYHYITGVLGIRPAGLGFTQVEISPQLGVLSFAAGALAHPEGDIRVSIELKDETLVADIELPGRLTGTFVHDGFRHSLNSGSQRISIPAPGQLHPDSRTTDSGRLISFSRVH